jgi:hypothetical protein
MRATLDEVLDLSPKVFKRWDYHHAQPPEASIPRAI